MYACIHAYIHEYIRTHVQRRPKTAKTMIGRKGEACLFPSAKGVRMCVYTHTCLCLQHQFMYMCTQWGMPVCMSVRMCVFVCVHACMHERMYVCMHEHMDVCMSARLYELSYMCLYV